MGYPAVQNAEAHAMRLHEAVAARVKALVDRHYGTNAEAAERMGVDPSRLSRLRSGSEKVYGALVKLDAELRAGGMDPLEILGAEDGLPPQAAEAGRLLESMSPQMRGAAMQILRALSSVDDAMPSGADMADLEVPRRTNKITRRVTMDGLRAQLED